MLANEYTDLRSVDVIPLMNLFFSGGLSGVTAKGPLRRDIKTTYSSRFGYLPKENLL